MHLSGPPLITCPSKAAVSRGASIRGPETAPNGAERRSTAFDGVWLPIVPTLTVPPSDTPPLDAHSLSVQSLDPHSVPCHTEELPAYDRVTYGVYIYLDVSCNNRVVAQSNSKA